MSEVQAGVHRIIRASAGAGKTYQLTGRYLALLQAGAPPQSILATTFTRKAAGEILGRIMLRLAQAGSDAAARAQLAQDLAQPSLTQDDCLKMLRHMVGSLHRLSISTIDGFFNRIARSFCLELDLPADAEMIDESDAMAQQLRMDAIDALLAGETESAGRFNALMGLLNHLHHEAATRRITSAIDSIVTDYYGLYRAAPDRAQWSSPAVTGRLDGYQVINAINTLQMMEQNLPQTAKDDPNKPWHKAWLASLDAATNDDWDAFCDVGLIKKMLADERKYSGVAIDDNWQQVYQPLIDHAGGILLERLAKQTEATYDLLHQFDQHYTRLRHQARIMLFSDLTYKLAHELPRLHPDGARILDEMYFRLDGRVTHLLLDEFQDTSLDQWAVFAPLVEEIIAYGDGSRSFVCVGDAKQAIYGWRGGCVALFDHVEQLPGLGDEARQSLSKSWRSSSVVLDAVNRVFDHIADAPALAEDRAAAVAWQKGFHAHEAAKDLPGYVCLETTPQQSNASTSTQDNGDAEQEIFTAHEEVAAKRIAELHRQHPGQSIGVLVATNDMVDLMLYELRKMKLHVSGEGGNPLSDEPAVAVVLSALIMADHPGDTVAAFHVCNSPIGPIVGLNDTSANAVERSALAMRRMLLGYGYARTIGRWVRELAPSCNYNSLQRLTQLTELAQRYDAGFTLRPTQFVAYVQSTRVEQNTPAAIRVMTINKAKGLEFDTVVLPQLDKPFQDERKAMIQRPHPTADIATVCRYAAQAVRQFSKPLQDAYKRQREVQRHEDLCKLYVAMTRAKHGLYMFIKVKQRFKLCPASILRHALEEIDSDTAGSQLLYERGDAAWWQKLDKETPAAPSQGKDLDEPIKVTLAGAGRAARRAWATVSPSSLLDGQIVTGSKVLELHDNSALRYGSLIHHWFSMVGFLDGSDGVEDDQALLAAAREALDAGEETLLRDGLKRFKQMLARPGIAKALRQDGAYELWRERDFVVHDGRQLLRGTFDRVCIDRDDGRAVAATLIDFKTDRVDGDTLEPAVATYRPQLEAYRRALARMLDLDPDAITSKLLFVSSGDVVDLQAG